MKYCKNCMNTTSRLNEILSCFESDKGVTHKVVQYKDLTDREMLILKQNFAVCDVSRGDVKMCMIVKI